MLPHVQWLVRRIRARAFIPSALLMSLMAGPLVPELSAATLVIENYSGRIVSVSAAATEATGVIVGDTITGSFSYDSTQTGSSGSFTFTGSSKAHTMAFKIFNSSNQQVFTDSYSGNVSAYYLAKLTYISSTAGTTLDLKGDTVYKQGLGVTGPGPPPAFDLTLSNPNNGGGYTASHLPLPTPSTISNFISSPGTLAWDPDGQSFVADIYMVPEPSSLILAILALVTCTAGFLVSRQRT
jgi:hypothetical protein